MIATVDTNVLVSGVFFGGVPGKILTAAREGVFTLATTPPLLIELREVFARAKLGLTPDAVRLLMDGIEDSATIVYPRKRLQVVARDPDDDAVVDCAVESGSQYIVSGDAHLAEMAVVQGITEVTPRQFVDRLNL
ncbi:MAG: putative toxin-antitoxin system toxin component, PIN family [Spirochaetota bacterium]